MVAQWARRVRGYELGKDSQQNALAEGRTLFAVFVLNAIVQSSKKLQLVMNGIKILHRATVLWSRLTTV